MDAQQADLPLILDLTVLSRPRLLAACLFACVGAGREAWITDDDLATLTWLPAGLVLDADSAYLDAFYFHRDRGPEIRALVPSNPRLDSPFGVLGLLFAAERLGWLHVRGGTLTESERTAKQYLGLPETSCQGFQSWDGTFSDFLDQPWSGEPDSRVRWQRERAMTGRALEEVRLPPVDREYRGHLHKLGGQEIYEFLVADVDGPSAPGVLRSCLKDSLVVALGNLIDGSAEHVSNSPTFRRMLTSDLSLAGRDLEDRLAAESVAAPLLRNLNERTQVEEVIDLIQDARRVEALASLFGLSAKSQGLGTFVADMVVRETAPKPVRLMLDVARFVVRRRQKEW